MQLAGVIAGGVKTGINASAVALTSTSQMLNNGVYLNNIGGSAILYYGGSNVTAANGFPLAIGGTSPLIPVSDPSKLFVISGSASASEVRWIGS